MLPKFTLTNLLVIKIFIICSLFLLNTGHAQEFSRLLPELKNVNRSFEPLGSYVYESETKIVNSKFAVAPTSGDVYTAASFSLTQGDVKTSGNLQRALKPEGSDLKQLFREELRFYLQGFSRDYSFLTIRSATKTGDELWSYSPFVGARHKLVGTNRSDRLLASNINLNDFLGFSYDLDKFEVVASKEIKSLIFINNSVSQNQIESNCRVVNFSSADKPKYFYAETLATKVYLLNRDWNDENKRMVVYFDKYGNPLSYFSYGLEDKLLKSVLNFYAITQAESKRVRLSETYVVGEVPSVLTYNSLRNCQAYPTGFDYFKLDPAEL